MATVSPLSVINLNVNRLNSSNQDRMDSIKQDSIICYLQKIFLKLMENRNNIKKR